MEKNNRLYVSGIPWRATKSELTAAFSAAGTVVDAFIVRDGDGRSRGFGFIEMENDEQAQKAIELWNQREFGGRVLQVNVAQPRPEQDTSNFV